jgi:L-amino acid N-acyltransferase YncA
MIRHASSFDIAMITSIYNEAVAEGGLTGDLVPVSLESRQAWFSEHQSPYAIFVIEDGGLVVGYFSLSPYRKGRQAFSKTCEISYYVSRQHRDRGIGKKLIAHAIEHARALKFSVVVAILLGCNQRSIKLLERFDFRECGRVPNAAYINGSFVDHLYMSRSLDRDREPT